MLAPACISVDHPRFLSFVPAAPTEASILFDLVVGASSIYAGSWLEGGGAVFAENEALRWIADLAGLPATAGGVFVSGGTAGNLQRAARRPLEVAAATPAARYDRTRGLIVASAGAHSSVAQAARAMDADVVLVPADERGRLHGRRARGDGRRARPTTTAAACSPSSPRRGTTNAGVVDDLAGGRRRRPTSSARGCTSTAPTAAPALAAPSVRDRFAGIERADSFIVDPHKWLFAPFDSCALLYRDPGDRPARPHPARRVPRRAARRRPDDEPWNASDYAHHLSRRARGLPFWFSLATHGTDAYTRRRRDDAARRPRRAPT